MRDVVYLVVNGLGEIFNCYVYVCFDDLLISLKKVLFIGFIGYIDF